MFYSQMKLIREKPKIKNSHRNQLLKSISHVIFYIFEVGITFHSYNNNVCNAVETLVCILFFCWLTAS